MHFAKIIDRNVLIFCRYLPIVLSNKMFDRAVGKCYYSAVGGCEMRYHMDSAIYASMLYDFYGALLSESQRAVMALYHEDNLSLSEIAEELGQTRQAVHYTLKKAEAALEEYEKKLRLLTTYEDNQEMAEKAAEIVRSSNLGEKEAYELLSIIKKLAE